MDAKTLFWVFIGLYLFLGFMLGAVLASGWTCFLARRASGESWLRGRSHCDSCGHELGCLDLLPVIGFLSTGGRCRYCREKIPAICIISELTYGVMTMIVAFDILVPATRPVKVFATVVAAAFSLIVLFCQLAGFSRATHRDRQRR